MKKIYLSLIAIAFAINFSYAQDLPLTAGSSQPLSGTLYSSVGSDGVLAANNAGTNRLYQYLQGTNAYGLFGIEGSSASLFSGASAYATVIGSKNATSFHLGTNGVVYQTITSSGLVGIGTTSPSAPLQVQTSGSTGGVQVGSWTGGSTVGAIYLNGGFATANNYNFLSGPSSPLYINRPGGTSILFREGNGTEQMVIVPGGKIGIGTTSPDQKLTVKGTIHSQEVIVDMSILPDYVFKPDYHLPTLTEVKTYIDKNHHLPEMPSAKQVSKDGLSLGDMNAKLLKKVEELTLYLIDKDKIITDQQKQLTSQQEQINLIHQRLELITKKLK